ncbi:unnamed protein product [Caenorhabditis sp. 36 PRJEB53466]|nr:unnamed protein product [Caenorhabditis sp. 36 PRJEB53466]
MIPTENEDKNVGVELVFRKPRDVTDFELVKTIWVEPEKGQFDVSLLTQKPDEPLTQALPSHSIGSSCSDPELQLPEDLLNEPLEDDVFEDPDENVETDLLFRQPKETEFELIYTILKAENHLAEIEPDEKNVRVDLWFREPNETSFQLIYTIPLMEDVAVAAPEDVFIVERIPPSEELDNVVESADSPDDVHVTEFTFTPIQQTSGDNDEETVTTEAVTILENPSFDEEGGRELIEKVHLTSDDTLDEVEDPKEEEAFRTAFVKSVDTPTPEEQGEREFKDYGEEVVEQTLKEAAEKLENIRKESREKVEPPEEPECIPIAVEKLETEAEEGVRVDANLPRSAGEFVAVNTSETFRENQNHKEPTPEAVIEHNVEIVAKDGEAVDEVEENISFDVPEVREIVERFSAVTDDSPSADDVEKTEDTEMDVHDAVENLVAQVEEPLFEAVSTPEVIANDTSAMETGAVQEVEDAGQTEEVPEDIPGVTEEIQRVKRNDVAADAPETSEATENAYVAPVIQETEVPEPKTEESITKTTITSSETPHKITDVHFSIPKDHPDYGNDYVPFGTEVKFSNSEDVEEEEEDALGELNFRPIRQWKDEDVISLQSLKSLVAEVGCTTETETPEEVETLKILKVVPSEPSLMELDISNDPNVIHVPIPLLEPATKYLEEMVDWIIADAVKEVAEREVVTESELSEMVPEPLADMKFPFEDEEKTPEPEKPSETPTEVLEASASSEEEEEEPSIPLPTKFTPIETPQRPPRAPKSKVRFGPLSIKLGRSYSEEQKALEEMLDKPLEVITSSSPPKVPEEAALSPLSPSVLEEYEHVPMMDMRSVPHSPQEKIEDEKEKKEVKVLEKPVETRILTTANVGDDEDEGSECLDSIGDLSERTIQRFNTSIDDPSFRRDSFSSISSFGDRQNFRTAIENIRQDLLPFQSSVSQYLEPSTNPVQLVANLSMDSPSDLSPNAPPVGFENTAQFLEKLQAEDRPSAEGSIDSSGFEKVDHDGLDDYVPPVADPMQQSVFGSLQADDVNSQRDQADDGFVFIERSETPAGEKMSFSHRDDVIEKNYGFGDADAATAKLLESPIAEEARKLVQDAVESASELSKHVVEDADEIGKELLDSAEHKIKEVEKPVTDTLHKAYDGLGDFVHDTVPQAVEDFVKDQIPEEPAHKAPSPRPITPDQLVDIHESVDQVHDEIDHFLRGRDPTPPLEADEEDVAAEKPHFGNQTPEEDETTFDRKGPLTIPEEVEKAAAAHNKIDDDLADFDPLITSNTGAAFGAAVGEALTEDEIFGHQKFETVPRPPTPPKDISDEDVKPSTVNLGPAHHHSHPSSPHHSILKHHGEPWVDFKTIPPCVNKEENEAMSKLGAIGRGVYALVAFAVNIVLRVGLHVALVAGVAVSVHEAYKFSKNSGVLQRKEGRQRCDPRDADRALAEIVFVARRAMDGWRDRLPITVVTAEERRGGDKYASAVRSRLVAVTFSCYSKQRAQSFSVFNSLVCVGSRPKMAQTRFNNRKTSKQAVWVPATDFPGKILDVIYWRDAKKSAVVLSLVLLALFILAKYPLLTVITYTLLGALVAAAGFRVFKKVESQIKKTDAEHPFSEILAKDLSLPQEKVHAQADVFVEHATSSANTLKKLVFVENPFESIKFGLVLWSLTYIASWFSGFTLAILAVLGVFSVPKVYESNQEAIDPHLATISGHLKNVQNLIDEKLPFLRSAPVAPEEKKDQ